MLAVLLFAYIFNYVDRQIISILAVPIKADLQLSDTQVGLMGGLAFALFYSGLGIPIARLADRRDRVNIIAISVAVWSLFTALCGTVHSFAQLFLARMGVGIGEAGGVAPSYALIADSFPEQQRARALAIFLFGIPIGSALGIFFGGWIAANIDWRSAFLIVGLAGLPVALLVRLALADPRPRVTGAAAEAASFGAAMRLLSRKPSFWLMSIGNGSGAIAGYGLLFWLPSFFRRSLGLSLFDISLFYGAIVLVGGVMGIWATGWLGDRLGSRRPAAYALVPAIAVFLAAPLNAGGLFAPSLPFAFILFLVPNGLGLAWAGPVTAAIQAIVPTNMRATASAGFLFFTNLLGLGIGTLLIGVLSDRLDAAFGEEALRYAILGALSFYMLGGLLYLMASRFVEGDWHREEPG
jgi:MFS family permease